MNVASSGVLSAALGVDRRKRPFRLLFRVIVGFAVSVGAVGALHTQAARPWLMKLAGVVGCPMGKASAAEVDAVRHAAVARDLGTSIAPAHPAFGFVLGSSTIGDVRAWQNTHRLSCTSAREDTFVRCVDVPSSSLGRDASFGTLAEVAFGFARGGALNSVSTLRRELSPMDAQKIGKSLALDARTLLGPPSTHAGSFEVVGGTATQHWRFLDYAADLTVTGVPGSGFVVREQTLSTNWTKWK